MPVKAIQLIQLGTVMSSEKKARETIRLMKESGYEGIELNGFMIKKMPPIVKVLTSLAGMPIGKTAKLDWHRLIRETGLKVVSVHEDLGSVLRVPDEIIAEAESFGTRYVVITGMHRFDYSDRVAVLDLAERLNRGGKRLKEGGISLLYHNHNCELRRVNAQKRAYDILLEQTDPRFVNFEFDSYWFTEGGANALAWMQRLGSRMKLWHINDRGSRVQGPAVTPILKTDSMELGTGNMDLDSLLEQALKVNVDAVILESHRNWIDDSPLKSAQVSAQFLNRIPE